MTARRHPILLALLLAVATAVRLPMLGQSLWLDEVYSHHFASHALDGFATMLAAEDVHPPVYYLALKAWMLLGGSEVWMRMLSVLAGVGAVGLVYAAAWTIRGPGVALLAGSFAALNPQLVDLSQQARPHMLMGLFVAAAIYMLARIISSGEGRWWEWLLLGVFQGLALLTFYYSAFFVIGINLVLLVDAIRTLGRTVPPQKLISSWLALPALFMPWIPGFLSQASRVTACGEGMRPGSLPTAAVETLLSLGPLRPFYLGLKVLRAPVLPEIAAALVVLIILLAVRGLRARNDTTRLRWLAALAGGIAALVVLAPVASWWRDVFFTARYFGYGHLLAALLGAEAVAILVRKPRWRAMVGGALCLGLAMSLAAEGYRANEPWPEIAGFVDDRIDPGDLLIGFIFIPVCCAHYMDVPARVCILPTDVPGAPPREWGDYVRALTDEDRPHLERLFANYRRVVAVWAHTVRAGQERGVDVAESVLLEMGFEVVEERAYPQRGGVQIRIFERVEDSTEAGDADVDLVN
ncbi:MAG: glycosyltransferase family 39 protein [Armatimonadota bacterium]|jgi:4-amino-4-deoxy-L-arabinose transferase-like glycosyltransferase